jgi:hypothetical protein
MKMSKLYDKIIKKLRNYSFSSQDLLDMINNKANLVTYSEIANYKNIDQLLGKHEACIILVENKPSYGHWICIFKNPLNRKLIEVFDSYGMKPDDELKYVPKSFRKKNNSDYGFLSNLLLHSPYQVEYNDQKLQKWKKDISTCGRWVGLRLLFKYLPLNVFTDMMQGTQYDPDELVTLLSAYINKEF